MKIFPIWMMAMIAAGWLAAGTANAQPAPAPQAGATANATQAGATAAAAAPQTTEQRLEALEQRQKIMERQRELDAEAAEAKAKTTPVVTAGSEGFSLASPDGSSRIRFRGLINIDARVYVDDDPNTNPDTISPRRVRPYIEGTVGKYFDFALEPDFGDGKTTLLNAFINARFLPEFNVKVGKFKAPVGLERLQNTSDVYLVEPSLASNLTPGYDVGVMVSGEYFTNFLTYSFGVFNGVPDGQSADRNVDGMYDYAGRVFIRPFKILKIEALSGLGVGIGASSGLHFGVPGSPEVAGYKSAGQATFFKYLSDGKTLAQTVVADGSLVRYSPQFYYYYGPFGVMGEYDQSIQDVRLMGERETLTNIGWQVTAMFVLTGEDATYKSVKPRQVFDPKAGTWGAWQLVGRYSELTIDEDAFPIFADDTVSAERAHAWAAGLDGYLNPNVRIMFDYEETAFFGGGVGVSRPVERVYFSRFQVNF